MRKKRILAVASAVLALVLALGACAGQSSSEAPGSSQAGDSSQASGSSSQQDDSAQESEALLGAFTATDLQGNEVDESILAEHDLTMVNVWATFCGPCLQEMPELGELADEYADRGVQVVGIVIDVLNYDGTLSQEQVDLAAQIAEETGADYLHLLPSMDLIEAKLAQVTAVPETFFVNSEGEQVGESYLGARSKAEWAEIIEGLLEE